ncbi:MAG: hypothetical protein M3Q69_19730 [Acidobacteriota bacterium]|nr:hypothetical protein [Acidobacteriota bacterium]
MKRTLLALCTLVSFACATNPATTTTPPAAAPATATAPASAEPQCNEGTVILNATLWIERAAEYRASAIQTYSAARRALDLALADPTWTGAEEETPGGETQPPAVILDLDETALDNSGAQTAAIRAGKTYDKTMWKEWTRQGIAPAVPGAAEFLAYARSRGVTPFYVTNRDLDEEPGTRANLERLNFPLDPNVDTLLQRGENGWKTSDKSPRRAFVASKYRVLLLIGDDLNDFTTASGKTLAERDEIFARTATQWGSRWFILPNPMYGSWETAAIAGDATQCEKIQRRLNALREK